MEEGNETHTVYLSRHMAHISQIQGNRKEKAVCEKMCGCFNSTLPKERCLAEELNKAMRVIHMDHFTVPRRRVQASMLWLPSKLSFCCYVSAYPQITTQWFLVR